MSLMDIAREAARGRYMHIAGEGAVGDTTRDRLRRQIDDRAAELATLEDLAVKETSNLRRDASRSSLQTGRSSALQTQVADKRAELEALMERERALGLRSIRETSQPSIAIRRASVPRRTGAGFGVRRGALVLALAPVLIISAAVLILQLGNLPGSWLRPNDSSNITNELMPAISGAVGDPGASFFSRELTHSYTNGQVVLSGPAVPGAFAMDDEIEIIVMRPDGTRATWTRTFAEDCGTGASFPPQDVTHLFGLGRNTVTVVLYDRCGEARGLSGPVVLSNQQ